MESWKYQLFPSDCDADKHSNLMCCDYDPPAQDSILYGHTDAKVNSDQISQA